MNKTGNYLLVAVPSFMFLEKDGDCMAKYEYIADQEAMKEFVREINAQCWRYGYKTQAELGAVLQISQPTAGKYLKNPDDMTFATLRRLIKVLKPNPLIVLRALGYSSRDIKQLLEKNG